MATRGNDGVRWGIHCTAQRRRLSAAGCVGAGALTRGCSESIGAVIVGACYSRCLVSVAVARTINAVGRGLVSAIFVVVVISKQRTYPQLRAFP